MSIQVNNWPGLVTNASPHSIPPGAATEQINCYAAENGTLVGRGGNLKLNLAAPGQQPHLAAIYLDGRSVQWLVCHAPNTGVSGDVALYAVNIATAASIDLDAAGISSKNAQSPYCFLVDRKGVLYGVNGLGRGFRWNGLTSSVQALGIDAPSAAPTVSTGSSGNACAGTYSLAYRFIDADGNPGNLSVLATTAPTAASQKFTWSNIGIATTGDSRVTARELWRSTVDESDVLYQVTTLMNNSTATYSDTLSDATLLATTSLPLYNDNGTPNAYRFTAPPADKPYMALYQGRTFYYGYVNFNLGTIGVSSGSATVTNTTAGAFAKANFTGWRLYVAGSQYGSGFPVASNGTTALTLSSNWASATISAQSYALRPPATEEMLLYWSEEDEPESVPSVNALPLQLPPGDYSKPTGLAVFGGFMWAFHDRYVYRISYVQQPDVDMDATLETSRGCVNNSCWVVAEDQFFILDYRGVYTLSGGTPEQVSSPIDDLFRGTGLAWDNYLDWSNSAYWRGAYDPKGRTVEWLVSFIGDDSTTPVHPRRAIKYHLDSKSWSLDKFHSQVGSPCIMPYGGKLREVLSGVGYGSGAYSTSFMLANQGTADWVSSSVSGTATGATSTTLSDSGASFASTAIGAAVVITGGTGYGQVKMIASVTSTQLTLVGTWDTTPDTTSTYSIGGIPWSWKSGQFEYATGGNQRRELRIDFVPTTNSHSLYMEVYQNHNTTARSWGLTADMGGGVSFDGSTRATKEMKLTRSSLDNEPGYARLTFDQPADDEFPIDRCMSVRLSGVQDSDAIRIHEVYIVGVG